MYVGRIVVAGRAQGRSFVAYRVSSRSFPNRRAEVHDKSITVMPLDPADLARNPYISYNCIRVADDVAVVTNGTHTDMITERIEDGQSPGDAMALSLLAFGHERDELDTPRIAGAVRGKMAWLGIARKDELRVQQFRLDEDQALMVATYEKINFEDVSMSARDAAGIARKAYDLFFERPVCAAAAMANSAEPNGGFILAAYNPD
ncbi:MAG: IMP cyclohydrolase [Methanothrix sp.]